MKHINEYNIFDDVSGEISTGLTHEVRSALQFLDWVSEDMQFNTASDHYHGFLNVGLDLMDDPELQEKFKNFVKHYQNGNIKNIVPFYGFQVEGDRADLDETVISKITK